MQTNVAFAAGVNGVKRYGALFVRMCVHIFVANAAYKSVRRDIGHKGIFVTRAFHALTCETVARVAR